MTYVGSNRHVSFDLEILGQGQVMIFNDKNPNITRTCLEDFVQTYTHHRSTNWTYARQFIFGSKSRLMTGSHICCKNGHFMALSRLRLVLETR